MQNTQNILVTVIFALVIVIGVLVYDRHQHQETLGEKVGESIDRATQQFGNAIDDSSRPRHRLSP